MLKNINQAFAEDLTPERFATFVAAVCEEGSDQVELLSAGHGPIFVCSSDNQSFQLLDAQGFHWESFRICGMRYLSSSA